MKTEKLLSITSGIVSVMCATSAYATTPVSESINHESVNINRSEGAKVFKKKRKKRKIANKTKRMNRLKL